MLRTLYTFLFYLILPGIFLRLKWRSLKVPAYGKRWSERLGMSRKTPLPQSIWIHAPSVGETSATAPLVTSLQARYPDLPIIITNTTPTGSATAQRLFGDSVTHHYIPLDLPSAIQNFFRRFNPKLIIVLETELWPNLVYCSARHGIPVLLANARLSADSAKRYGYIKRLTRKMLADITCIAAQTSADAQRFIELGARPQRVRVTGNLKFNVNLPDNLTADAQALRQQLIGQSTRPIFIVASTHEGEEAVVLKAFAKLKHTIPDTLLLLAPRHPERFDSVEQLCRHAGFTVARYSQSLSTLCPKTTDVLLGDTMGKLFLFYAVSDVAFVAGSLRPNIGGHNLIEPALLSLPIITGRYLSNWEGVTNILRTAKALHQISNADELAQAASELLLNKEKRISLGRSAKQVVSQHTDALDDHLSCVTDLLNLK